VGCDAGPIQALDPVLLLGHVVHAQEGGVARLGLQVQPLSPGEQPQIGLSWPNIPIRRDFGQPEC